jgi:simple sugar transport system ATP-binding protein
VLTPQAVRRLFDVLRTLAADGCSILYISHKLDEIRELCDRATVLKAGRVVGTATPKDMNSAELARLMVGSAVPVVHREEAAVLPDPRLEIVDLSTQPDDPFATPLQDVCLNVHGGEIVGIAGISGNGQAELLTALCEGPTAADSVKIDGKPVGNLGAAARRARGLAFVPEERLGRGAVPHMTLAQNALLTGHGAGLVRFGLVDRGNTAALARRLIEQFRVKCTGASAAARNLSGGNLQKFIMGREMALAARVLIVSQPTWGVDVAAAAFLRQSLIDLSRRGVAILVISEELDELFEICDRIAVMYRGRLSPLKLRAATTVEETGLLMTGVGVGGPAAVGCASVVPPVEVRDAAGSGSGDVGAPPHFKSAAGAS